MQKRSGHLHSGRANARNALAARPSLNSQSNVTEYFQPFGGWLLLLQRSYPWSPWNCGIGGPEPMVFPPLPAWLKDAVMGRPSMVQDSLLLDSVLETLRIGKLAFENHKEAQVSSPQQPVDSTSSFFTNNHTTVTRSCACFAIPIHHVLDHHARCPRGFRRCPGWIRRSILRVPIGTGLQERLDHRCPVVDDFGLCLWIRFGYDH